MTLAKFGFCPIEFSTIIPIYLEKNLASEVLVILFKVIPTAYYSYAISISTLIVALAGPTLGSIGDRKDVRKPIFTFFMLMGVLCLAALAVPVGWIAISSYSLSSLELGAFDEQSRIFYDSGCWLILRHSERVDEVSSHGYAWGYIGSCIPFTISLLLILGC